MAKPGAMLYWQRRQPYTGQLNMAFMLLAPAQNGEMKCDKAGV